MNPVPAWFNYVSYLMAAVLAACVALQFNDPDPIRWMAIYGAGMLISILLPSKRALWVLGVVVGLGAAAWSIYLVHETWGVIGLSDLKDKMSEYGGAVEEGREAGGLAIEAVWLLAASAFRARRA